MYFVNKLLGAISRILQNKPIHTMLLLHGLKHGRKQHGAVFGQAFVGFGLFTRHPCKEWKCKDVK